LGTLSPNALYFGTAGTRLEGSYQYCRGSVHVTTTAAMTSATMTHLGFAPLGVSLTTQTGLSTIKVKIGAVWAVENLAALCF